MMFSRIVLIIVFITFTKQKTGDYKPFCYLPEYFDTTVQPSEKQLNLHRLQGAWYEIARLPIIFERNCPCGYTVFEYKDGNNYVNETDHCLRNDGSEVLSKSKGYPKNQQNTFFKNVMYKIFSGNQFFIDFDDDMTSWALVGEPCRDYLWIFSRQTTMDDDLLTEIIQKANDLGYDTSKFLYRKDECQIKDEIEF